MLLSDLIYVWEENGRIYHNLHLYSDKLQQWALDMIDAGYDSETLYIAAGGANDENEAKKQFYDILMELNIASTPWDFNGELMDRILIEEYKRGLITAIDFMRQSDYRLAQKTGFPYGLSNGKYYTGPFFTGNPHFGWYTSEEKDQVPLYYGDELEKLCAKYILKSGIISKNTKE